MGDLIAEPIDRAAGKLDFQPIGPLAFHQRRGAQQQHAASVDPPGHVGACPNRSRPARRSVGCRSSRPGRTKATRPGRTCKPAPGRRAECDLDREPLAASSPWSSETPAAHPPSNGSAVGQVRDDSNSAPRKNPVPPSETSCVARHRELIILATPPMRNNRSESRPSTRYTRVRNGERVRRWRVK